MAPLSISLLGQFRVTRDEQPIVAFESDRVRALLAYLVVEADRAHDRSTLAGLLWPERPEQVARTNLRHVLHNLRRAIDDVHASPPFLLITQQTIQWNSASDAWIDVVAFARLLASCQVHAHSRLETCAECIERLKQAVTLHRGNFLAGVTVSGSVAIEEWARITQEQLHRLALEALYQLAGYHEARQEYVAAIHFARRQVEIEPWREEAHRQLMRLLAWAGRRSEALTQYAACRRILAEELRVEPSAETIALYERIRAGNLSGGSGEHWQKIIADVAAVPRHNLPAPLTSFIGRGREIADIKRLLAESRLVTLTGAGGCGKTRLAIQVATQVAAEYADGVWLVELAPLSDPALVPQAVAAGVGIREATNRPFSELLVDALRSKQVLLVLDNCEHLVEACAQLAGYLLSASPNLRILATSREVLGITGERVWRVPTLSLPDSHYGLQPARVMPYEGIRLFVERARAVKSDFALTEHNAPAIAHICQRLDGIPLAIELAAARIKMLSAEEIAAYLGDRFSLLTAGNRAALPRHQTLRAMVGWSYDLLSEPERVFFRRLSVFAGGFTLQAAEAVTDVLYDPAMSGWRAMELLSRLVDKSLVIVDYQGQATRYRLLETIREYGREKMAETGEVNLLRQRHLEFFLGLAEECEPDYNAGGEAKWVEMEHDNLRAAIDWALESEDASMALQLVSAVSWLWWMRGYIGERKERLQGIVAQAEAAPPGTLERMKMLNAAGAILATWGCHTEARRLLEEALAIGAQLGHQRSMGLSLRLLGTAALNQGDYPAARSFLERGVTMWRELGGRWHVGWLLTFLGDAAMYEGDSKRAQTLYEEAVTWFREFMAKGALAYPVRRLGYLALYRGDYERATALCRESLGLNMEVRDKQGMAACLAALAGVAVARGQAVSLPTGNGPPRQTFFRCVAQLFGIVEALLNDVGTRLLPADNIEYERHVAAVRSQLDEATFAAAWAAGRAMTLVQALAYALADDAALAEAVA